MTRPNLLVIHTDQQATWSIGAYGGGIPTPHIDRLASEGVCCEQAYTNSAVCTPSRGCLMTGRYPHVHGAERNNQALNGDEITWAELLRRAGWQTAYHGKWHLDGARRPGWVVPERGFGFSDTRFMFNRGHWKKIEQWKGLEDPVVHPYAVIGEGENYTTDWLIDRCCETIDAFAADAPFCLMCSIPDPHDPFTVRAPYQDMFRPEDMPVPASLDTPDQASWIINRAYDHEDPHASVRRNRARYLGLVACIDENVGRLLDHLAARDRLDDTIIVFTSDHGEYMGEHRMNGKNKMFRSVYNIPLLLRWPQEIPAGLRLQEHISTVDMLPTLCALCGVETAGREQGRDASALLRGEGGCWRDESQQYHGGHELAGIIGERHHLILHRGGEHRLFDYRADGEEMRDLSAAEPALMREMGRRLLAHHEDMGSPCAGWLRAIVGELGA